MRSVLSLAVVLNIGRHVPSAWLQAAPRMFYLFYLCGKILKHKRFCCVELGIVVFSPRGWCFLCFQDNPWEQFQYHRT